MSRAATTSQRQAEQSEARGSRPMKSMHANPDAGSREIFFISEADGRDRLWVVRFLSFDDKEELPALPADSDDDDDDDDDDNAPRSPYQELSCRDPGFRLDGLLANENGTLLCIYGRGGVAVVQLSRRVRDEIDAGQTKIMCSLLPVDEEYFRTYASLPILRVAWRRSCLWVLTSAGLRVYDMKKSYLEPQADYPTPETFVDFAVVDDSSSFYFLTVDGELLWEESGRSKRAVAYRPGKDAVGQSLAAQRGCCSLLLVPQEALAGPAPSGADEPPLHVAVLGHRCGVFELLVAFDGGRKFEVLERLDLSLPPEALTGRLPAPVLYWDAQTNNRVFVQHAFGLSLLKFPWLTRSTLGGDSSIELLLNTRPLAQSPAAPLLGVGRCDAEHVCVMTSNGRLLVLPTADFSLPDAAAAAGAADAATALPLGMQAPALDSQHEVWISFQQILRSINADAPPPPIARVRIANQQYEPSSLDQYQFLVSLQPELDRQIDYCEKVRKEIVERARHLYKTQEGSRSKLQEIEQRTAAIERKNAEQREQIAQLLADQARLQEQADRIVKSMQQLTRGALSDAERRYFGEIREVSYALADQQRQVEQLEAMQARAPVVRPQAPPFPLAWQTKITGLLDQETRLIDELDEQHKELNKRLAGLEQQQL